MIHYLKNGEDIFFSMCSLFILECTYRERHTHTHIHTYILSLFFLFFLKVLRFHLTFRNCFQAKSPSVCFRNIQNPNQIIFLTIQFLFESNNENTNFYSCFSHSYISNGQLIYDKYFKMSNLLYAGGVLKHFQNVFYFSSFSISSIELEHP